MKALMALLFAGVAVLPGFALLLLFSYAPDVALLLAVAILLLVIVVPVLLLLDRYQLRRRLVAPTEHGLLPVTLTQVEAGHLPAAALAAYHQAEYARAAVQPVPVHYSPHIALSSSSQVDRSSATVAPVDVALPSAITIPTFAALLDGGRIGRGQPLCLGVDVSTGDPAWGGWRDLYSAGLGGVQGSGKSWTAVSLLAQSVLNGAGLLVIDPHEGDSEALSTRLAPLAVSYLADVAADEKAILAALKYAQDALRRRQEGDRDRTPIVVAVDEWTSLLRRPALRDVLPSIVSDFSQEGRKYGVNCLLLAQRWAVGDVGGGAVRNTLTACYIHRTRKEEARMLSGLGSATPDDTITLGPGEAYLVTTRGELRRVATPRMEDRDLHRVAGLLTDSSPTMPRIYAADQPQVIHNAPDGFTASQSVTRLTPEQARIVELFRAGMDAGAIVTELTGRKSNGGRPYLDKLAEVQAAIRLVLVQAHSR
jgi:hypothetical protein